MKTKIEIIDETVKFYGANPEKRRSLNTNMSTGYEPYCLYNGPDGKHCAFARCVENPDILNSHENAPASSVFSLLGVDIMKPDYRIDDKKFWWKLQSLHDTDSYWAKRGLTVAGKKQVEKLKQQFS